MSLAGPFTARASTALAGERPVTWLGRLALVVLGCVAAAGAPAAPAIEVEPAEALEGQRVVVRLIGLAPGQPVTLHAARLFDRYPTGQEAYRGRATFIAGADGRIDTARDAPTAESSYAGVDPAGLFWSMAPVRRVPTRASDPAGLADPTTLAPGDVLLELESEGRIVARAKAWLAIAAADVAVHEVREGGVVGVYAAPAGTGRRPAVIVLGGSEGGLFTVRSMVPLLASHGYAVLGLGYFRGREPELAALPPTLEDIPLEVLEAGRRWLLAQPGVAPDRLALVGVSKGAELALLGAATYAWVDAVAAFAPSHVVWEGIPAAPSTRGFRSSWTLAGRPLPFVPWSLPAEQRGDRIRQLTGSSRLTDAHLESLAEAGDAIAAATIPIERSRAALLLVAGVDDAMWPSAHAAGQIEARLAKARPPRSAQLEYVATGHQVLGTGWAPTTAFQRGTGRLQGGNAALDAAAQAQGWARLLAFLSRHLGPAS